MALEKPFHLRHPTRAMPEGRAHVDAGGRQILVPEQALQRRQVARVCSQELQGKGMAKPVRGRALKIRVPVHQVAALPHLFKRVFVKECG